MIVYLSAAISIAGLILYLISTPPKPTEVGRIMFFCGLFVFLLMVRSETFRLP